MKIEKVTKNDNCNVTHVWLNGKPADYDTRMDGFLTKDWLKYKSDEVDVIHLHLKKWMFEANTLYQLTGTIRCEEELDSLSDKSISFLNKFVRSEHMSFKYGMFGSGPYNSLKEIVLSLITAPDYHSPLSFYKQGETMTLYLFPWRQINKDREFRVFVHNKQVSAISQQFIDHSNVWFDSLSSLEQMKVLNRIVDFANKIEKINCIIDLVVNDDEIYFIELNPFGEDYGAGSALFHWVNDRDILYGNEPVLRYYCT